MAQTLQIGLVVAAAILAGNYVIDLRCGLDT
jgi:hypothetical protein